MFLVALALIGAGGLIPDTAMKFVYAGSVLALFVWIGWSRILTVEEKVALRRFLV